VSKTLICIAGPTASGKSGCAIELAKGIKGEVINADAIQVYEDLHILSARPTPQEMEGVPHHLFGTMGGEEKCSAGRWARAAARIIEEIHVRQASVILVGGTGLYFKALEEGLSPIPHVADEVQAEAYMLWERLPAGEFYNLVVELDPAMAHLNPADGQRLMRVWSVAKATGQPLSYFQSLPREPLLSRPVSAKVVMLPPRDVLYERCEKRFDLMMSKGALQEAKRLKLKGLVKTHPVMKALGAAELIAYLDGDYNLERAIELSKRNTRRFAKRQMTWFRGQAKDWLVAQDQQTALSVIRQQLSHRHDA